MFLPWHSLLLVCASIAFIPSAFPKDAVGTSKPVFTHSPKDAYPLLRHRLTLECSAVGDPVPDITWFKDGEVVQTQRDKPGTSNRITNHGELLFLSFSSEDEGSYYCNATNMHGWALSKSAVVKTAFFDPSSAIDPEGKTVSVGDPVLLECDPPKGLPEPQVNWIRNGSPVKGSQRIKVSRGLLKIEISNVMDAGTYRCIAENLAGHWESKPATLTVQRKPRFKFTPGNKQVLVGESVDFQCLASDDPNSTILWRRAGEKIPRASLLDRKSLRIENVQASDAGNYICEAKNTAGLVEAVAHLSVISPPSFLVTPNDLTIPEGGQASFDCLTSGSPPPTVRWVHDGKTYWVPKPLEGVACDTRYCVYPNGTLRLNSVSMLDEGLYECKASQIAGIVKSSAYLSVNAFNAAPLPLIELGPQNQTLFTGTVATLSCQGTVVQFPFRSNVGLSNELKRPFSSELTVHWYINDVRVPLLNDPRIIAFSSGSLQINAVRLTDGGIYTCEVRYESFEGSRSSPRSTFWSASVTIVNPQDPSNESPTFFDSKVSLELLPDPPEGISLVEVGNTWMLLNVDYPILEPEHKSASEFSIPVSSRSSVIGFRVEVAEYNSSTGWKIVLPLISSNRPRVDGLKPSTGYYVLVRSVNSNGVGRPILLNRLVRTMDSALITDMDPTELSRKVDLLSFSHVRLRALSSSEILADWSVCSPDNDFSFISNFKAIVEAVPLSRCIASDSDRVGYMLRDDPRLSEAVEPQCVHKGYLSDLDLMEPENELEHCSISELTRDQDLNLSPPQSLNQERSEAVSQSSLRNHAVMKMAVTGLRPFLCYSVLLEVAASHPKVRHIYTKRSASYTVLTYDSPPTGAPQIVEALWLKNGTILEFKWSTPPYWERGGILTGFSIRILGPSPEFSAMKKVGPEQRSFRVHNLNPHLNYTIYLAALNCRGEGIRSSPINVFANPSAEQYHVSATDRRSNEDTSLVDQPSDDMHKERYYPYQRRLKIDGREAFTDDTRPYSVDQSSEPLMGSSEKGSLTREPWFIVSVIAFSLLWILVVLGLILCGRHRGLRHRRRRGLDSVDVGTVTKNGRPVPSSDSYPLTVTGSPILSANGPEITPLVGPTIPSGVVASAYNPNYFGEKVPLGNGYPPVFNQNNGMIPVGGFPVTVCNGVSPNAFSYQYSVGPLVQPVDGMKKGFMGINGIPGAGVQIG
ncbi:unnamed protein product [Calicophoron daubneyi]|uniref:Uncharacterized protein n=1 Tax=Calicophoron daubneyi TaxID=300641 RepID=A0AAV2TJ12_CALDB